MILKLQVLHQEVEVRLVLIGLNLDQVNDQLAHQMANKVHQVQKLVAQKRNNVKSTSYYLKA